MKISKLGVVVSISKGKKHSSVFDKPTGKAKRYIQIEDLRNDFNLKYTDENGVEVNPSDIIIAWDGANAGTIGFNLDGFIGSTLARLRIENQNLDSTYLGWLLRGKFNYLRSNCTGATIPHISRDVLENIPVPLFSKKEQQRIATILEQADTARQKRKQANQLTEQFLQSTFLEMFGDPVRNEKGWEVKKLVEISTKIHSGNTPKGGSAVYVERGIFFFRSQNVWRNRLDFDDIAYIDIETHHKMMKSSLMHGDILMTKTGRFNTENSSLGRAALYVGDDNKANVNGHVYLIRLQNQILRKFVLFILTTNEYRDYIRSVCVGGIDKRQLNKEHLENFPIINPPISLQQKFVALVEQVEILRAKQIESEKELENLFQVLMQKYFGN
jgi:type I restriction enzyme, S subunit